MRLKLMQRDTSSQGAVILREQQPSFWRSVVTWQSREFLVEALEAKVETQRVPIFQKKFASLGNVNRRLRPYN
jgi:hypothetical protein